MYRMYKFQADEAKVQAVDAIGIIKEALDPEQDLVSSVFVVMGASVSTG